MREVECFFLQYASFGNFAGGYRDGVESNLKRYWLRVAYGPLTATGQVRRDVIQRLLPGSRLAARMEIEGDFLGVQGDWNVYQIHLGSGMVRMGKDQRFIHPNGYAFTAVHLGLPPGNNFPQLPFGGDVRLAGILRNASRLTKESKIDEQQLIDQIRSG
jgi:hypothetical protein